MIHRTKRISEFMVPRLFDVTLRDGIQAASPLIYTTDFKKQMFKKLIETRHPNAIEIGSIVSPKVLPIMGDSMEMHKYAKEYLDEKGLERYIPLYMLIPSFNQLHVALKGGVENFSFITSISEKFQQKNTRKTLAETKHELASINEAIQIINPYFGTKLYISCINHCPIDGKQRNNLIAHELYHYFYKYHFGELCMSDTCGMLSFADYKEILDSVLKMGVPADKLSLHLHVGEDNKADIRRIVDYSLTHDVNKFDVSELATGGCSVTMEKNKCNPNMSYECIQQIIKNYVR